MIAIDTAAILRSIGFAEDAAQPEKAPLSIPPNAGSRPEGARSPLTLGLCAICGSPSWWLQVDVWRCRRCTPPSLIQLEHCETYVAAPNDPPTQPNSN